jgi:hypothetical protein
MSDLFGDTFGNYMLHGIEEIQLPEPISWWPQTLGWKLLALAAALWACYELYRAALRWWHNRYRRTALAELAQLEQRAGGQYQQVLTALPELLKATALQVYPRDQIAALSGDHWLAFLDQHYNGPSFREGVGRQLLAVAYQSDDDWQLSSQDAQQLIQMCRRWIGKHRAPRSGTSTHA